MEDYKIPLKLVYHLYIPNDVIPEIYKYHFACLKYFADVFDEYDITFAMDNTDDITTIKKWENKFFDIGICKNVTFNVVKNNPDFREAITFKSRVLDKLSFEKSLVFFAHSKGSINDFNDSLIAWIVSMYYFDLTLLEEMKYKMVQRNHSLFCGHLAWYSKRFVWTKYNWIYPGSFYWINCPELYNFSMYNEFPKMSNRFYAECFPGNIAELKTSAVVKQRGTSLASYFFDDMNDNESLSTDLYYNYRNMIVPFFDEDSLKKLDNFIEHIKNHLVEFDF